MTYLLAIDQGTTNSRAILFNQQGEIQHQHEITLTQSFPQLGWVEQDPETLFNHTLACCRVVISGISLQEIAAVGISNQRETTLLWNKNTGQAIYPAIVWQDRRTAGLCQEIANLPISQHFQAKTGLRLDPYFSLTKVLWILNHVPDGKQQALNGDILFGTVDTYLLWRLTGGRTHATDASNAARTLMFNIKTQCWDEEILNAFDIPKQMLPNVMDNNAHFGEIDKQFLGYALPITGMAGDQQAAAIGQACFQPGMLKATYGTGAFLLLNTGKQGEYASQLLTTILYRINNEVTYGIEGSIFSAGTTVKWLRDTLHLIQTSQETEILATMTDSNKGVYLIPAFTGLGAPYWNPQAKAAIVGLTRDSARQHIVRAALESVAYQTLDLLQAMLGEKKTLSILRVDGGMTANYWLMQFLADMLQIDIHQSQCLESSALGAAYLAGLGIGIYSSLEDIANHWKLKNHFRPKMNMNKRDELYRGWKEAVARVI